MPFPYVGDIMIDPRKSGPFAPALFEYGSEFDNLSHYLFRYPAKFHPPIVRSLIERLTQPGDTVCDPFMGSGTLAVEALVLGRNAVGMDVDPIAVAVARAKAHRYQVPRLRAVAEQLLQSLQKYERPANEYEQRMFVDLSKQNLDRQLRGLRQFVPAIPQIEHWFRRYVIVDLAKIKREISRLDTSQANALFLDVVFASIIRNSSNADPVPVSGLEVTSHMKRKDEEGRSINPFALFRKALLKAVDGAEQFTESANPANYSSIYLGDASRRTIRARQPVEAVITSPPYHGAVDYYRRHKLEMYWLAQTKTEEDRLRLLDHYIGRVSVPRSNRFVSEPPAGPLSAFWEAKIREINPSRANAFRHYQGSMRSVFLNIAKLLKFGKPAAFVVGHSKWNGTEFPTRNLFEEIAGEQFVLEEFHSYPLKNRYMSYTRHNGANIQTEHVLIFRRTNRALP